MKCFACYLSFYSVSAEGERVHDIDSFVSYFIDSGDRSRVISTQDIVLSTCEVTLKPQPCTRHDCGSEIVSIMAVSDFIDDGDRMTMILTKPAVSQSSLWKSYDPPDAIVSDLP